jgi:hypothetical protein
VDVTDKRGIAAAEAADAKAATTYQHARLATAVLLGLAKRLAVATLGDELELTQLH